MAATTSKKKQRGSLVDTVTLKEYPFQYEPTMKDKEETSFGKQHVIGRRLPSYLWVGHGSNEIELSVHLIGASNTSFKVTSKEVGEARFQQLASYQKQVRVEDGTNPDGSTRYKYIKNPEPRPKPDSAKEAREKVVKQKREANAQVLRQIQAFKDLKEPQDDIGAPHPLFVNVGGVYTGRKFVLVSVETSYLGFNLADTMDPYEAILKLKLEEIPSDRKYAGAGARS